MINEGNVTCVSSSIVGKFEALLAWSRAFLNRSVREESGSMIKSSIGHVTGTALHPFPHFAPTRSPLYSPLPRLPAPRYPPASLESAVKAMSKRPVLPQGGNNPGERKNLHQSVNQMPTQIAARDIPIYLRKQPPLDPEAFVYVEVALAWSDSGRVSLVDVRMAEAKLSPARFSAFFTGGCAAFLRNVKPRDKLCLYLSDAVIHDVEEQCKQNTLDLPFSLAYDKRCRLKRVEKGLVGSSITYATCT